MKTCHVCQKEFDVKDLHDVEINFFDGAKSATETIVLCDECLFSMQSEEISIEDAAIAEEAYNELKEEFEEVKGGHHLNVNVLNREKLIEAMEHPERHPLLVVRVSGYAISFNRLSREQQEEVISRTFHDLV